MDFYVKLGIFQVEGVQLKTNYSFLTNPPGITASHPWPPDQGDQKCGLGVLDFVVTGTAPRELRGPLPLWLSGSAPRFHWGWTRATDTPFSSALYLGTLVTHLWNTSDPALPPYFPTQNTWPREGKWLAQDHTAVWRQSQSGSFPPTSLPCPLGLDTTMVPSPPPPPSITGDSESWVIYKHINFILISHLVLNLWLYNPNGWTYSASSWNGPSSDSLQSISGVKLQRVHRPQHLAWPPPHSILITTYVTEFTAHPYLWSQLTPFLLPGLFPPQGCLSSQCAMSAHFSLQVALPTWLTVTSLLWSSTPCFPGHSLGSRHLGSVMLLILSYVSLTSRTRFRRLEGRVPRLQLCIHKALLNRPPWRRTRSFNGHEGWRQQAEVKRNEEGERRKGEKREGYKRKEGRGRL